MSRRKIALGAAVASCVVAVSAIVTLPAYADGASGYLAWSETRTPCFIGPQTFNGDPDIHSQKIFKGESSDDNNNTITRTWIQNGVSAAMADVVSCNNDVQTINFLPTAYKHRHYIQVWNCNGGGCGFLFDHTDGWVDGTEFP